MCNATGTQTAKLPQLQFKWWIQNHKNCVYCAQDFTSTTVFGKNSISSGLATPLLSLSLLSGIAFYYADS